MDGPERLTKQRAMGVVFVNVGKALCIREMYTDEPSFVVVSHDLGALYGSGRSVAAAWIDAARNTDAAR